MSIVSVTEIAARSASIPKSEPLTNRREFVVLTNSTSDGESQVLGASGIPKHGDQHPSLWSAVDAIEPERDREQPLVWHVVVSYKGVSWEKNQNGSPSGNVVEQRLWQRPSIHFGTMKYTEPVVTDILTGALCGSSTGERFDPLPTRGRSYLTVTITRYEPYTGNTVRVAQYLDTVNDGLFWGLGEDRLWFYDASSELEYEESVNTYYWHSTYVLAVNRDKWTKKNTDRGFYHLVQYPEAGGPATPGQAPNKVRNTDSNGEPTAVASLLDGHGKLIPIGPDGKPTNPPVTIETHAMPRANFNVFGFPQLNILAPPYGVFVFE